MNDDLEELFEEMGERAEFDTLLHGKMTAEAQARGTAFGGIAAVGLLNSCSEPTSKKP